MLCSIEEAILTLSLRVLRRRSIGRTGGVCGGETEVDFPRAECKRKTARRLCAVRRVSVVWLGGSCSVLFGDPNNRSLFSRLHVATFAQTRAIAALLNPPEAPLSHTKQQWRALSIPHVCQLAWQAEKLVDVLHAEVSFDSIVDALYIAKMLMKYYQTSTLLHKTEQHRASLCQPSRPP